MTKNEAITIVNSRIKFGTLNVKNTHWSNVVEYGVKSGWWLNVPFQKFQNDLNLLLNVEYNKIFYHLQIPGKTIQNPASIFRNKEGTADIFIPITARYEFIDEQSSGSGYNFSDYEIVNYLH